MNLKDRLFMTKDGVYVVGQKPNRLAKLAAGLSVLYAVSLWIHLSSERSTEDICQLLIDIFGVCALTAWLGFGMDELINGVNLFRRILGVAVMVLFCVSYFFYLT